MQYLLVEHTQLQLSLVYHAREHLFRLTYDYYKSRRNKQQNYYEEDEIEVEEEAEEEEMPLEQKQNITYFCQYLI
ncbi:hypothetical protein ACLKA6_003360 [Drosophila palustris]